MAMGEGIGGSGISQQRSSSEVSTRKTAGAIGAASSSGRTEMSAGGLEHHSGSGTPVFLASARLRSTWCELSERPVAERQSPPEKSASEKANAADKTASAGRAASAEKPSIIEKPAVFGKADAYEKPAGAGAAATEISRGSVKAEPFKSGESDRKQYTGAAQSREFNVAAGKAVFSASHDSDSRFNLRDGVFSKNEATASQAGGLQGRAGQILSRGGDNRDYSASAQPGTASGNLFQTPQAFTKLSESPPQIAQYLPSAQNELSRSQKGSGSSGIQEGLQKFNVRSSVLSAFQGGAGTSESLTKPNLIKLNSSVFTSEPAVRPSQNLTNLSGQAASALKDAGSQSLSLLRPNTSLLRDAGQQTEGLLRQTAAPLRDLGRQTEGLLRQTAAPLRDLGQQSEGLLRQTAAPLRDLGQLSEGLLRQTAAPLRDVSRQSEGFLRQTAAPLRDAGPQTPLLQRPDAPNLREAGQQLPELVREIPLVPDRASQMKALQTPPVSQPPLLPARSASAEQAPLSQPSLQQQLSQLQKNASESSRGADIQLPQSPRQMSLHSREEQAGQSQQLKGTTAPDRQKMQGMNAGFSAQEGDEKRMQGGSSQQKLEKMAAQSLTYGSPLAAQPLESSFSYASFAQNSVWDSLRLIWKTFLTSTEADIHELYSAPQEQYMARGEEKGQKYSASSAMMQQDAVLTLPVRAWHESDAKKQEKSAEKAPGRDGSDRGQPVPHEEKRTASHITDSEDLRDEEGDGEKGRSGGEQKDGEEKEKEGKKDKEQGKGRDGRRNDGRGKTKGGAADGEEDEALDSDGMRSESADESQDEEKTSEAGADRMSEPGADGQPESGVDGQSVAGVYRQPGPGDDRSLRPDSERISEPAASESPELPGLRSPGAALTAVPGRTAAEKALDEIRSLSSAPAVKRPFPTVHAGEGEIAGYLPMWDIEGLSNLPAASRNQRGSRLFAGISERRPMFRRRAGDLPFIYMLPATAGPSPCFPLFAQIYSESTSPMGVHQLPPPRVHVDLDILREDLMEMLEKSVLQPIRMTVRASRFVASVIEDMIKKRFRLRDITKEYFASYVAMMMRMSGEFTFSHSLRTMDLALEIAKKAMIEDGEVMEQVGLGAFLKDIGELDFLLSRLPFKERDGISGFLASRDLRWAGVLHDIGKIRIPREVLYKPGALTDDEFRLMKMHPIYSEQILYPVTTLRFLCPVVRAHHERWDGKGYPDRLEGNSIPMAARIIAIADVFDALISDRPYKKGMPWPKVKKIMTEGRGTHFDPVLLDLFIALVSPRYEKELQS